MTTAIPHSTMWKLETCKLLFERSDNTGALQIFDALKGSIQNKVFTALWQVRGEPREGSPIHHFDFGRVSMLDLELPRCKSTAEEKAMACVRVLDEHVRSRLGKELADARAQQQRQVLFPSFTQAQIGNIAADTKMRIKYEVGFADMRGRRSAMEDASLIDRDIIRVGGRSYPIDLYGIFDGHGGGDAAQFVKHNVMRTLLQSLNKFNAQTLTDAGIYSAFKETFFLLDQQYQGFAGSTVTLAVILNNDLWVANIGDSRTILNNGGQAIQLSEDHKNNNPKYVKGVTRCGGVITWDGRVNGNLAIPRAVGDHQITGVVHSPTITKYPLRDVRPGSSLILGCDGVWDVCSTEQVAQFEQENRQKSPDDIAESLIGKAYRAGSADNMSAMIVQLKP